MATNYRSTSTVRNQQRLIQFTQQRARLHNWLESQHSAAKDKDMDERRRLKEIGV